MLKNNPHDEVILREHLSSALTIFTGNDVLWGGAGNDLLMGFTAINDTKQTLLVGEADNDKLYGEAGADRMFGGLGNDYLDEGMFVNRWAANDELFEMRRMG